jgi:putative chitinase
MTLNSPRKFYESVRQGILGPTLSPDEVSGCTAILDAFEGHPVADVSYALGTAFLETGGTMQPIQEYGGPKYYHKMYDIMGARPAKARELGNIHPGDGILFPGRGFPQVTGRKNYTLAEKIFGIPFSTQPELMLKSEPAAKVMQHFMKLGLFTGRKLADTLPRSGPATLGQFTASRPIINGRDRAADVARFAMSFQGAVLAGEWK